MGAPCMEREAEEARMIPIGTVVFATDDSEAGVADARAWLASKGYTRADVRLIKREGQVLVIAERGLHGERGN